MNRIIKMMDAYRRFARRHPIRFLSISLVLVVCQVALIMHFSGENADISGARSAKVLVGIVNVIAPTADVTLDNYETLPALHNSEKVVRKIAHMIEYGVLSFLVYSFLFGFRDLDRRYAYILPVVFVAVLGMLDEKNQTTITGRYGSWFDVSVDIFASVIAVTAAYRLTRRYREETRRNKDLTV